ncbi:MAG: RagB/SusD family nutrient uptake outer membrane protein [Bacteroidota bacterium]
MKRTYKYTALLLVIFGLSACDYLDIVPDDTATVEDAFSRKQEAERFLYSLYAYTPRSGDAVSVPDLWGSDEVAVPFDNQTAYRLVKGESNPSHVLFNYWSGGGAHGGGAVCLSVYEGIRQAYIFLEHIEDTPGFTAKEITEMEGEATFIIAYLHYIALRQYGPIVLVRRVIPFDAPEEEYYPQRVPYDECVDFIVQKLDEAYPMLAAQHQDTYLGRITKSIAKGLKGRLLMYAASPLFNGNPDYAGVAGPDGTTLFPASYDAEKWKRAADALKEAIDEAEGQGYTLYREQTGDNDFEIAMKNCKYTMVEAWNSELIWGYSRREDTWWSHQKWCGPRDIQGSRHGGLGTLAATFNQAEIYLTENGLPMDQDPAFDYANRYTVTPGDSTLSMNRGREPRFYANIGFDRGTFLASEEEHLIQLRYEEIDGFGYEGQKMNHSLTGYMVKKGVHPKSSLTAANYKLKFYAWPLLRLSELYLDLAEALNEYGHGTTDDEGNDAIYYLDQVRSRAGIPGVNQAWTSAIDPSIPTTKEGLREIIQTEREIELAFEGHRIWDVRRWKRGEEFNEDLKGLTVTGATLEEYNQIKEVVQTRNFVVPRDYLWPIATTDLHENPNLVQNLNW